METGEGSRHRGRHGGTSYTQMGGFGYPSESIPPFRNSIPDVGSCLIKIAKVNPPEFDGSKEPDDIINWMTEMEKLLTTFKCPEQHKVSVAAHYVKKSAHEWWEAYKPMDHEPMWEVFKNKMVERFYPGAMRFAEEVELIQPRPENETVDQAAKMMYKVFHNNPSYNEERKISLFQARLSHKIREGLDHKRYASLEKYVIKALNMEASMEAWSGNSSNKRRKRDRCANCGSEDHVEGECAKSLRKCHGCGEFGHIVAYCTHRRN